MEITQSCIAPSLANKSLNGLILQMVTITVNTAKGDHALTICPMLYFRCCSATKLASTFVSASLKRKMCFGCQNLNKTVKLIKEAIAAVMSGNSGPTKLEVKYCAIAKAPPPTNTAGQVSFTPRQPSIIAIIQNSTIGTINGN